MEIIGIICEYNPFHNGHIYHIKKIKEMYPNSIIILILNGYFLERGEVSLISKYDKTKIALNNNIDLVCELPCLFGTQSADTFAQISLKILNELKVNRLIFGSESNDIKSIINIAKESTKKSYNEKIKQYLDEGLNYPTALAKGLKTKFDFLPNDLLGISYVKAIINNKFNIIPETIQRTNDYLDTKSNEKIISASNIRKKLNNDIDITNYLPKASYEKIKNVDNVLLFNILKAIIIQNNNLNEILDVDEGIENRLIEGITKTNNLDDFINYVKTKRYTYNKINRMIIHILLGIKKIDAKTNLDYIKILGMNSIGKKHLNKIKNTLNTPIKQNKNSIVYKYELNASLIWDMLTNSNDNEKELINKPILL